MKTWTAHLRESRPPVLLREGFAWGALSFGPLWLAAHRAWVPAALVLAMDTALLLLLDGPTLALAWLAWRFLLGLNGHDLRAWSLATRGYTLAHVIAARNADTALARLLTARPDLAETYLPPSGRWARNK